MIALRKAVCFAYPLLRASMRAKDERKQFCVWPAREATMTRAERALYLWAMGICRDCRRRRCVEVYKYGELHKRRVRCQTCSIVHRVRVREWRLTHSEVRMRLYNDERLGHI